MALPLHMLEIECEISPQTFMRADLHYIIPVPHHLWHDGQKRKGKQGEIYVSTGGKKRK